MQNIEEIYEEYFETINKYLFCLTRNSDISEELTQETFYIAVQKIDSFKGECKISTWLCKIAKNLWIDELKKRKHIKDMDENELLLLNSKDELENIIISKENKIDLYKKLQNLDELTREVIYLRISGELSFKEIGTILNITETWARVTYYRGKEKLKEVV